ncbi:MAG: tetratricopeptide repeat protein [Bacteroidia bacterium]|nr:tetratricopeptide repeat protein [Bacteroidia bacterium]
MKLTEIITFSLLTFCSFVNIYAQTQNPKIDSLKQVIATARHDTTRINAYNAWGEQVYLQQPDSALILFQKAQNLAEKLLASRPATLVADTAKKQLAASLNNIEYIYNMQGDIPRVLEFFSKSLKIREEIGDKKGMAES